MKRYFLEITDNVTKFVNRLEFETAGQRWRYLGDHKILAKLNCTIREVNEILL